jgi:uncharacterized membrane protein YheB (UPF0754 family)
VEKILANLPSMVAMMAEPAIEKAKPSIAEKINETIEEEGPKLIRDYIGREYQNWMDKPVKEIAIALWPKREQIKAKIWDIYLSFLNEKAEKFIGKLDVASVVEEKINAFDAAYLEKLIMDIARKELRSLVWIGGLLGMLIGFVNLLF